MSLRRGVSLACVVALLPACTENLLPDPENSAAVLPQQADVAVGATHDLLIVACQDRVTLLDILTPVAVTALFVGLGRLDAALYLPDALLQSLVPECEPVAYTVTEAAFDNSSFELEATDNPSAFHAHAREEGAATFTAVVTIDGEALPVETTLRAWTTDHVTFEPQCDAADGDVAAGWVPEGGSVRFSQTLEHGSTPLSGYGLIAVEDERLTVVSQDPSAVYVNLDAAPGTFTLSSALDPDYAQELTVYEADAFDALELVRSSDERLFVGLTTRIRPRVTAGGRVPCVWGFPREVTIETPDVCGFEGATGATTQSDGNHEMSLQGLAQGVCRIRAEQPGTTLTASLELPVYRSFEEEPIDVELDLSQDIVDLWLAGPDEVFVVGYDEDFGQLHGLVLHRAGGAWDRPVRLDHAPLRAVHGARTDGSVVAVGNEGTVARWEGTEWEVLQTDLEPDLYGVWAYAADDVWVVGDAGLVAHLQGDTWSVVPTGVDVRLTGIWGGPSGEVIVVGGGRTALRLGDAGFEELLPPAIEGAIGTGSFGIIQGSSPSDLWILDYEEVLHFDGDAWTAHAFGMAPGDYLGDMWPTGDGTVYFVAYRNGAGYSIDRLTGDSLVSLPIQYSGEAITGLGDDVVVLAPPSLLRYRHDPSDVFP